MQASEAKDSSPVSGGGSLSRTSSWKKKRRQEGKGV